MVYLSPPAGWMAGHCAVVVVLPSDPMLCSLHCPLSTPAAARDQANSQICCRQPPPPSLSFIIFATLTHAIVMHARPVIFLCFLRELLCMCLSTRKKEIRNCSCLLSLNKTTKESCDNNFQEEMMLCDALARPRPIYYISRGHEGP